MDLFSHGSVIPLTKTAEEGVHGLVFGHVDQPSAQTEMREYQQHLLHDVVDAGDILLRETHTNTHKKRIGAMFKICP